jgi:hypothetical protein
MIWDSTKAPDGSTLKGTTAAQAPFDLDGEQQEYLLAMLDAPVTIHRAFIELCDNLNAAALLSDLSYSEKEASVSDWISASTADVQNRVGLSPADQRAAQRLLVERGFIEEAKSSRPARLTIRIRWNAIDHALRKLAKRRAACHPSVTTQ